MKYVYRVYEESHGLMSVCATPEIATNEVKYMAEQWYKLDTENEPLDYNSEDCWGWDGVAYWERMEVRH